MPEQTGISEEMIEQLVHHFYARIQADRVLGPIFVNRIEDWEAHLGTMVDFWSSVMLKTGRFNGRPVQKHQALSGVSPEHFRIWLSLFGESAKDLFSPEIAAEFLDRAERIAASLGRAMFPETPLPTGTRL